MQLNAKGNLLNWLCALFLLSFISCTQEGNTELSESDQLKEDSLSKVRQRAAADSMKKKNPLLIIPPDSDYTGEYTDKYAGGIVKFKGYFRFGQRHGTWMSFYPNGLKWSEMHYEKGMRHGPNQAFYMNGKIRYEGTYKNDFQDSVWTYYDSTGTVVEKILYRNDRVIKRLPK